MPPQRKHTPEGKVVEHTYAEEIARLYKALVAELAQGDPEDSVMERFNNGVNVARKARDLAVDALRVNHE